MHFHKPYVEPFWTLEKAEFLGFRSSFLACTKPPKTQKAEKSEKVIYRAIQKTQKPHFKGKTTKTLGYGPSPPVLTPFWPFFTKKSVSWTFWPINMPCIDLIFAEFQVLNGSVSDIFSYVEPNKNMFFFMPYSGHISDGKVSNFTNS